MIALSFEERLGLMVDAEYTARKNKRLKRLIRGAGFTYPEACLEDVEYCADRKLDKVFITKLGTGGYIGDRRNIIPHGCCRKRQKLPRQRLRHGRLPGASHGQVHPPTPPARKTALRIA